MVVVSVVVVVTVVEEVVVEVVVVLSTLANLGDTVLVPHLSLPACLTSNIPYVSGSFPLSQ